MPLFVIYNPVCGRGEATRLFNDTVIPLLKEHGREPDKVEVTTHAGHAGDLVIDFLQSAKGPVSIVLGSGDGTLHEILYAFQAARTTGYIGDVNLALVPCGTANALYSSLFPPQSADAQPDVLLSLHMLLSESPSTRPLTLAITSLEAPGGDEPQSSISAVVTSTALHASILHDSEALRAAHPGIERFKMAAQQNITRWYSASVRFLPPCSIYRATDNQFVPCDTTDFAGPFVYFLSTVNVDRLEPFFRITPLHAIIPPPARPEPPTLDVVVVRPLRDKSIHDNSLDSREQFSRKCMTVLGGAYQDGAHVKMTYGEGDQVSQGGGQGEESVVEYIRCRGWEWVPDSADETAHFVCADGEILHIRPDGKAVCTAVHEVNGCSFHVYA
ncbi:hypothetical protein NM688_g1134 [Phlebia brevispora]|uniref:Uncharacterized protein n=1 Tax=Phlebia brevispora TaxID=194682 RepID=A0ACC1TC56_9APHY|nr:hypothetical protein NM688_g1134 [Phlebia brevispora]